MLPQFFSKELYIQGIKKTRSIGIGAAATIHILSLIYTYINTDFRFSDTGHHYVTTASGMGIAPFSLLMIGFALAIAASEFSFLNSRKASDFYHSIPHKRVCVYTSFSFAIITWIVSINLSTFLINGLLFAVDPRHTVLILPTIVSFFRVTISSLVGAGVVLLCRMISGTGTELAAYTLCILAVPRMIFFLFKEFLTSMNPSIWIEKTFLRFFTIENSFVMAPFENFLLDSINIEVYLYIILLTLEAIVLFITAGFLYKKRNSERAGQNASIKFIQMAFRATAVSPFLIYAFWLLIFDDSVEGTVTLIALGLLTYFILELIFSKSPKKAIKSMPLFILPLLFSGLIMLSSFGTSEIFKASNPKEEEIEAITLVKGEKWISTETRPYLNTDVKDKTVIQTVITELEKTAQKDINYGSSRVELYVKFTLKNGEAKYRNVIFYDDSKKIIFNAIESLPEFGTYTLPSNENINASILLYEKNYYLTNKDKETIIDTFREEYNSLTIEEKKQLNRMQNSHDHPWLYLNWDSYDHRFSLSTGLTPKTALLALKHASRKQDNNNAQLFMDYFIYDHPILSHFYITEFGNSSSCFKVNLINDFTPRERIDFRETLFEKELCMFETLENVYLITDDYQSYYICLSESQIKYLKEKQQNGGLF